MKKREIKVIGLIPIFIMLVGYILLVLVRALPNSLIEKYAERSANILYEETDYPNIFVPYSYVDNYTDADCISIIWNTKSKSVFYNGLDAFERFYDGVDGRTANLKVTINDKDNFNGIASSEDASYRIQDHSYLWNGFQIWLKPLLMRYDISDIRVAMTWCVVTLIVIISIEFFKKEKDFFAVIPFLLSILYFSLEIEAMSVLFFTDITIALGSCLYIFNRKNDNGTPYIAFTIFGALIAFFSMLIMPLIAFGYPMVVFLYQKRNETTVNNIKNMLSLAFCWIWGYASVLFAKVFLSKIVISSDSGSDQISKYIGGSFTERIGKVWYVFKRFIGYGHLPKDILAICIVIFFILIVMHKNWKNCVQIIPYILMCFIPIVWTFVMCGHAKHNWTVFNYSVAIFSLLEALYLVSKRE